MNIQLLTIAELAQITNESVATWRKRIFLKRISYVKCGRNVRVPASELDQWLRARTVASAGVSQ